MAFKPATRRNAKLRLALSGTSGAGKTFSALQMAQEFGTKIALMDSERGSASKYAGVKGLPAFDVSELEEKNVQAYLAEIQEAARAGYEVLIIDSYSHSWIGALETIDKMGGWIKGGKVVSPLVQKLVDAILSYPGHVIATMRSKADYAIEKDERTGKATMKKLGMATVARDGTDYEFDVMLELTTEGAVTVSKTRCSDLAGCVFTREEVPKIARVLKSWLTEGAPMTARDAMADRIRFAQALPDLQALIPDMKALPAEDLAALKPVYAARKAELSGDDE